jgi:CheY-like chemotaxis protein/HPt (histidine-containing phosphotransfer) domain-containing protein
MSELLLDTPLNNTQRQYAEALMQSGGHLLELINDILDFSRIEAGKLVFRDDVFNFHSCVEAAAQICAMRAYAKGLEFALYIDQRIPLFLRGDAHRCRQILINLAGNAVKFTEHGEVRVEMTLLRNDRQAVMIQGKVSDTGPGIDHAMKETLFESFSQLDASSSRQHGGTGLGLAISKKLCEHMHGTIDVHSSKGKGAVFTFTVRLHLPEPSQMPHDDMQHEASLEGAAVLTAHHHPLNRRYLTDVLSSWGCVCTGTGSTDELHAALTQYEHAPHRWSCALIETDMLYTGVHTQVREILQTLHRLRIPVVFFATETHNELPVSPPPDMQLQHVSKPVVREYIHELVAGAVNERNGTAAGGEPAPASPPTEHTPGRAGTGTTKRTRILCVEDDETNRRLFVAMVEKLGGLHIDSAADGYEAVALCRHHVYDCVFMDCQMPGMDGFEATRRIRGMDAHNPNVRVPVVALTAYALQGDREKCLNAGMDDYCAKPFNEKQIRALVRKWACVSSSRHDTDARTQAHEACAGQGHCASWDSLAEAPDSDSEDATPLFDREGLLQRLMNDTDIAATTLEAFLEDMPGKLYTMQRLIEERNASDIERIGHNIKGSCASAGAEAMRRSALALENAGREGDMDAIERCAQRLTQLWQRSEPVIRQELASL